jgi:CubicO group peptidase (beta-lactamase class C family)
MSPQQRPNRPTRSEFLRTATGTLAATAATSLVGFPAPAGAETSSPAASGDGSGPLFEELDAKIRAGMKEYAIPGVAVGVIHRGERYIKGYGVTNVDYPVPVDGDTPARGRGAALAAARAETRARYVTSHDLRK